MSCPVAASVSRTRSYHGAPRRAQESTEMRRILVSVAAAALFFVASNGPSPQASAARETAASDAASPNEPTEPTQFIFGPKTRLGYIAGVEVDPSRKEFYTVNNDSGDLMTVFSYDDHGNAQPRRSLMLPHQSWDVSLAPKRDEIVISVQQSNALSFYQRGATGTSAPLRTIRGLATELEDPHGTYFDEAHNE